MKKSLIALALAFVMTAALTGCSSRDTNGGTSEVNGGTNGTGTTGTGTSGTAGRTAYNGTYRNRAARDANDYLADGMYRANGDGQVYGPGGDGTWDLTQDARDMVRGAGQAIDDVGDGIGDAVRDVTGLDDTYSEF